MIGALSDKIQQRRRPLFWGAIGATLCACAILYLPDLSHAAIYTLLIIFGVFYGAQVIVFAIGHEIGSNRLAGTAIATTNMFVMMGGAILQPLVGSLLDKHWIISNGAVLHGTREYSLADYNYALTALPICLCASAVITLFIRETGCRLKTI